MLSPKYLMMLIVLFLLYCLAGTLEFEDKMRAVCEGKRLVWDGQACVIGK